MIIIKWLIITSLKERESKDIRKNGVVCSSKMGSCTGDRKIEECMGIVLWDKLNHMLEERPRSGKWDPLYINTGHVLMK